MRRAAAVVAILLAASCGNGDGSSQAPPERVQDLELPTAAQTEAAEKLHEAEVFLAANKSRLAEPLLRQVLVLDPSNARACEALAQCLIGRGRLDEAAPLLQQALENAPRSTALRALHVRALMNLGDFPRAETAAREWTKADAQNADAWYELGRSLYRRERWDDAIAAFRRAETLKAARADIRSELGLALAAAGQLGKAETKLRDAIDRQPDNAEAWFRLGDVISRRGTDRTKEAIDAMAKAVDLDPSVVTVHLYLFRLCRIAAPPVAPGASAGASAGTAPAGTPETPGTAPDATGGAAPGSVPAVEPSVASDPVRARGEEAWKAVLRLHGRAQIASVLGRTPADEETSEFALREQVSLHPDEAAPRLALARHLHSERRIDEAIEAYRGAIERGAATPATHTRLAAALVVRGDVASAEKELEVASASGPADASVQRLRAWVLLLAGRDTDALAAADAALAAAPDDVLAKKLRALARMHAGDVDAGLQEIAALGWL